MSSASTPHKTGTNSPNPGSSFAVFKQSSCQNASAIEHSTIQTIRVCCEHFFLSFIVSLLTLEESGNSTRPCRYRSTKNVHNAIWTTGNTMVNNRLCVPIKRMETWGGKYQKLSTVYSVITPQMAHARPINNRSGLRTVQICLIKLSSPSLNEPFICFIIA